MSKDMLGPIVRALVAVPNQHHGVVLDFVNKLGGEDADDVRKRVARALRQRTSSAPKVEEPAIDTLIHVDREAPLRYPDWKKDVLHPELEHTGPADYDLADIVPNLWLHDGQKDGKTVRGQIIYDHLVANNMLESCLGLADGLAPSAVRLERRLPLEVGRAGPRWPPARPVSHRLRRRGRAVLALARRCLARQLSCGSLRKLNLAH
jgi:hypothetical protein